MSSRFKFCSLSINLILSKYFNKCIILIINTPEMKISKIYNKYSRTRVFIYLSSEHYEYCNCADDSFLQDIDISNFETIMPWYVSRYYIKKY